MHEHSHTETHIVLRFLLVQVIKRLWNNTSPFPIPPQLVLRFFEMTGEVTIEFALYETNADAIGDQPMARESVPLLSQAKSDIQLLKWAEINTLPILLAGTLMTGDRWKRRWQESCDVENSR